jgi:predicted 2-oxoglutarate/Fe(II)-dependent dioxygenase YbiX
MITDVFVKPDFLDPGFCRRVRAAMDIGTREPAAIAGSTIAEQPQVRRAIGIEIAGDLLAALEARIDGMRPVLEANFACRLGEREGTGLLRYEPGGFYRRHRDRGEVSGWPNASRRAVTIVVFLNDDFSGGALTVWPAGETPVEVRPSAGQLVAFRADDPHEAQPVSAGRRDVAVDWFYDPAGEPPTS